tara:strand:- start:599 stop:1273 length:675 start_codon:yes stop_codon:yes gene_type:complete
MLAMKKNILIFGYGDLAQRLSSIVDKNSYRLFGVSRTSKETLKNNHISWDWLSKENPVLDVKDFDCIIFIPKPSSYDEDGYKNGFIKSAENIFNLSKELTFNKFISISSTSVYGKGGKNMHIESDNLFPDDFRGNIIKDYESNQIKRYSNKLIILRFAGLYDSINDINFLNHLNRNNASKIINFFIETTLNFNSHEVFNCCEDREDKKGSISNKKLKELGFIFD